MDRRLVTVARFDIPARAHLARNALEDAGIQSVLQDEQLLAMDYLLNIAVGGIKVQVWEEDAEQAAAVLQGLGPAHALEGDEADADPDEPEPEDGNPPTGTEPTTGHRDEYARRAISATLFSVLIAPVAFYAAYLLLMTAFSEGKLTRPRLCAVLLAAAVTPLIMFLSPVWVHLVSRVFVGGRGDGL